MSSVMWGFLDRCGDGIDPAQPGPTGGPGLSSVIEPNRRTARETTRPSGARATAPLQVLPTKPLTCTNPRQNRSEVSGFADVLRQFSIRSDVLAGQALTAYAHAVREQYLVTDGSLARCTALPANHPTAPTPSRDDGVRSDQREPRTPPSLAQHTHRPVSRTDDHAELPNSGPGRHPHNSHDEIVDQSSPHARGPTLRSPTCTVRNTSSPRAPTTQFTHLRIPPG